MPVTVVKSVDSSHGLVTGGTTTSVATAGEGDKNYVHTQGSANTTWVITHNLGKFPAVQIVDSGGTVVIGTIVHNSANQLTATFSAAFSGKAYLN